MDPRDLIAASKYVNNLLASRGLLRGKEIAFHKPTEDDASSKIINLVHELLSRRDKEEEQRESLALTIRTLRSTEIAQAATIAQLKTKATDLERKNAILESDKRNFTSTLRTTEAAARTLKDESIRIKTTLSQVRTQCANDIRKRDVQIQKMKERLSDTRGRGTRPPMAQCTVIGGPTNLVNSLVSSRRGAAVVAEDEGSTLAHDTADFLTKLSQDLADENDNLIALVRTTLSTLKAIQGLPDDDHFLPAEVELDGNEGANPVIAPPASFEDLTAELDNVMYSLKGVLNQPNYVPLEELAERDAEIGRLAAKNTTLEEEWRKAIELVDGWNKTLGARFAEATKEERGDEVRSPRKTPGRGKVLANIVHEEDTEGKGGTEGAVVGGWRERRGNELSMVEEEAEQEEEKEITNVVHESPVRKERSWESQDLEPAIGSVLQLVQEEETAPELQSTPERKVKKNISKTTKNEANTLVDEARMGEAAEEAAVEEQILAEVHATPIEIPAKTLAKSERKVRISEAAPKNFEPKEVGTGTEGGQEENKHAFNKTPVRKETRRKIKNGVHLVLSYEDKPELDTIQVEKVTEKPRASPVIKDKGKPGRKDSHSEIINEDVEGKLLIEDEFVSQIQVSPAKKDRKRKAPKDAVETTDNATIFDPAIGAEAPKGRERKRRARKEDVITETETIGVAEDEETLLEAQPMEALRGREKRRRARKEDEKMGIDTTEVADTAEGAQCEIRPEGLVLKKRQRKRKVSAVRTDMDEILEHALSITEPTEPAGEKPGPSKRKERKSGISEAKEADESIAEDTFARLITRGEPTATEIPTRTERKPRRSRSRARRDVDEDMGMLDELAMEPVPARYEEIANEAQVVAVRSNGEGGKEDKPSEGRRRSLRNRDKYSVASRATPDSSPKKSSLVQKRVRKSSRKGGSSFMAEELDSVV